MEPLLQIKDLTTRFDTKDGVVNAVNGVSYTLDDGETLGVVGESGCGKSVHALSILRLIQIPPGRIEKGAVLWYGQNLLEMSESELQSIRGAEIAMVFQDPMTSLNPTFTVGFQIKETLKLHLGMNENQAEDRSIELLEMVGIPSADQRIKEYPHQFSGGMRQRAMIAMALSCNPKLLIADEPTTALDVTIQAQIIDLVKNLQSKLGMAVMWITHDLGVAAGLVKKINVMYAGYIIEQGNVKDIYKRPRHPYTQGLLASLPRLNEAPGTELQTIPGFPPDLTNLPKGCPFAERCQYVVEYCQEEMPVLESCGHEHLVACWRWNEIA